MSFAVSSTPSPQHPQSASCCCGMQLTPSNQETLCVVKATADHIKTCEALRPSGLFEVLPEKYMSPYPFGLSVSVAKTLQQNVEVMSEALRKAVSLYSQPGFSPLKERLRSVVPLCSKIENILGNLKKPFELGSWRPDFLLVSQNTKHLSTPQLSFKSAASVHSSLLPSALLQTPEGCPLICEINARFSFNGYYQTAKMSGAYQHMDHLHHLPGLPLRQHQSIEASFASFFDPQEPVVVLIGKEKGWDVHLFKKTMEAQGRDVRFAVPSDLSIDAQGRLQDNVGPITQAALELHQFELLGLSDEILSALASLPRCLNDLRSIFLVHDKRMLAALYDEEIAVGLVGLSKAKRLRDALVPSYALSVCPSDVFDQAQSERVGWVIKAPLLGKGADMLFGRSCAVEEWVERLHEGRESTGDVLQPFIPQAAFPIVAFVGGEWGVVDMHVVGLVQCFGRRYLGFGMWRASPVGCDVVNLAGGRGTIMLPVLLPAPWALSPPSCAGKRAGETLGRRVYGIPDSVCERVRELASDEEEETVACAVRACVERNGVCVVDCSEWLSAASAGREGGEGGQEFDDAVNARMTRFVRRLGPLNLHNSDASSAVWDVRPKQTGKEGKREETGAPARSKTDKPFPMHTDCCFEEAPPRYIGLFVVHPDEKGGGLSSLIHGDALRMHLSRKTLETLHSSKFRFRVAPEFGKDTDRDWVEGRVLSSHGLWRYRSEVVIRSDCTEAELAALDELDAALENPSLTLSFMMPEGALVVLDNAGWFHARSKVLDQDRWLKRIRFHHPDEATAQTEFKRRFGRENSLYRQVRIRTVPSQRFCFPPTHPTLMGGGGFEDTLQMELEGTFGWGSQLFGGAEREISGEGSVSTCA
uniref:TauD/TfdA-like domain-containing protein n=1 Tax=Chromera velia CCMP2878 TaxID=1169474 RepID=A0A0G4IC88_9ALVE|eukprot:Cvel_2267.t1-p1 / transcript=Cvel_2267.t1 / gene=Cvel_2267 / organism=Chromera_velia_CCMP2878 / gene_product=hypothetical protein / transcript_product=hypothetical protein / location=Cvel_scaffold87:125173-127782(-) / protein_length=870 / sequence_SO=supercontig / SO=protein_coding / is_pseudo=false